MEETGGEIHSGCNDFLWVADKSQEQAWSGRGLRRGEGGGDERLKKAAVLRLIYGAVLLWEKAGPGSMSSLRQDACVPV